MINDLYIKNLKFSENEMLKFIKYFLENDDYKKYKKAYDSYCLLGYNKDDMIRLDIHYHFILRYRQNYNLNRQYILKELELYNQILDSMSVLARELKLNNSLEYCMLYTYLLWNGYLSKNKHLFYDIKKVKGYEGTLFLDIFNGYSICTNNSVMLKDFLNKNSYKSIVLENRFDNNIKKSFEPEIKRNCHYYLLKDMMDKIFSFVFNRQYENHLFTLVEDKNQLYIYDATNLSVFNIKNCSHSLIINGCGKCLLFPVPSYAYIENMIEEQVLNKLISYKGGNVFELKTVISMWEDFYKKINNSVIEDFYIDNQNKIQRCSEGIKKIKRRNPKPNFE